MVFTRPSGRAGAGTIGGPLEAGGHRERQGQGQEEALQRNHTTGAPQGAPQGVPRKPCIFIYFFLIFLVFF